MSINSDKVKRWRKNTKNKMVLAMGGKCCICGYNKCLGSMDFHHVDPKEKEMGFGQIMSRPTKWDVIVKELRKCALVCSNCHGEIHWGFLAVPINAPKFNETYEKSGSGEMSPCPICGTDKPIFLKTCSLKCAAKKSGTVDWSKIDVLELIKNGIKENEICEMVGVTKVAVSKKIKSLLKNKNLECPYCKMPFEYKFRNQRYCSEKCARLSARKVIRPSKEQLEKDILEMSMVKIGEKYGVSDNAVRKWIKLYKNQK